jgi:predicted DNA-binding protein (UPF0251 family)
MVRPKKLRTISKKPPVVHFKPQSVPSVGLKDVVLHFEEFEALRLSDFKGLIQEEAAKIMKVSRPTFQRVLSSARYKVAKALSEGKAIKIEGGECTMSPRGFGRGLGRGAGRGLGRGRMGGPFAAGPGGVCVCTNPECKNEIFHKAGVPCYQTKCPKCGSPMIRRR